MNAAVDALMAADVRPFALAAAIVLALGAVEVLTSLVGFSISQYVGKDLHLESESNGGIGGLMVWINAGRLPLLILILLDALAVLLPTLLLFLLILLHPLAVLFPALILLSLLRCALPFTLAPRLGGLLLLTTLILSRALLLLSLLLLLALLPLCVAAGFLLRFSLIFLFLIFLALFLPAATAPLCARNVRCAD